MPLQHIQERNRNRLIIACAVTQGLVGFSLVSVNLICMIAEIGTLSPALRMASVGLGVGSMFTAALAAVCDDDILPCVGNQPTSQP